MSIRVKWGIGFAVFLLILLVTWLYLKKKYDRDIIPETYTYVQQFEDHGVPAISVPAMNKEGITGNMVGLAQLNAPVVIVNFWASWCNPCVEEFPSMLKLVDALAGKLQVLAVSMDDDAKDLSAFLKLFGVPRAGFLVGWDEKKKVMEDYGVGKLPESYILGKDRKLIRKVLGIENWASPNAIEYFKDLIRQEEPNK